MCLAEYEYLWDGSQPGWTLHRVDCVEWEVTFRFESSGPSQTEIIALRKLVDELRDVPVSTVYNQLKQLHSYTVAQVENIEMRALMEAVREVGLDATSDSIDRGGYLPVHVDGYAMVIEDDDLSALVAERMKAAGVPVVETHVD